MALTKEQIKELRLAGKTYEQIGLLWNGEGGRPVSRQRVQQVGGSDGIINIKEEFRAKYEEVSCKNCNKKFNKKEILKTKFCSWECYVANSRERARKRMTEPFRCKKCGIKKPAKEFYVYRKKDRVKTRYSNCIPCHWNISNQWRKNNIARFNKTSREAGRRYWQKNRKWLNERARFLRYLKSLQK